MPSLQVRDVPEQIYNKLQANAQKEHRSLAQQAIVTLAKGLELSGNPKNRRAGVVRHLLEQPIIFENENFISPADLIREDRTR